MARMDQGLIDHPNARSSWRTVRLELPRGGLETVVVVETDLIVNPDDPKHNADAYNGLVAAIVAFLNKNPSVDKAEVYPIGG